MLNRKIELHIDTYFKVKPVAWKLVMVFGFTFIMSSLSYLLILLYQTNDAYTRFGPAVASISLEISSFTIVIAITFGIFMLILGYVYSRYAISISQTGLLFRRPFLADYLLPFSDITGVAFLHTKSILNDKWQGGYSILWLMDGKRISLGKYISFSSVPEIVTRIKAELYPKLEARYRESLAAGNSVNFGSIQIGKSGLALYNKMFPWSDIKQLDIQNGVLHIRFLSEKHITQDVFKIPNIEIFLSLVRDLGKLDSHS